MSIPKKVDDELSRRPKRYSALYFNWSAIWTAVDVISPVPWLEIQMDVVRVTLAQGQHRAKSFLNEVQNGQTQTD